LQGVQRLVIKSQGYIGTNIKSTSTETGTNKDGTEVVPPTVECKDGSVVTCPDTFGYLTKKQVLELNEPFGDKSVPIGNVGFSAWKQAPWDVNIHPREYSLTTVVSKNDNGKTNMHSRVSITSNGESIVVPINNANY